MFFSSLDFMRCYCIGVYILKRCVRTKKPATRVKRCIFLLAFVLLLGRSLFRCLHENVSNAIGRQPKIKQTRVSTRTNEQKKNTQQGIWNAIFVCVHWIMGFDYTSRLKLCLHVYPSFQQMRYAQPTANIKHIKYWILVV